MKKALITTSLLLMLCSPVLAGGYKTTHNFGLPYTPQPRNPESKMYQPYYGYQSQRREQVGRRVYGNQDCREFKSYRPNHGRGRKK